MRGYGMKAIDFESFLLGRTIIGVYGTGDSDCGLILELSGDSSCGRLKGLCLYFGYSSCEGETIIVSKEDDLIEGEQDGYLNFSLRPNHGTR